MPRGITNDESSARSRSFSLYLVLKFQHENGRSIVPHTLHQPLSSYFHKPLHVTFELYVENAE
jgi:hypothetical protein